jgi:5-methyltetrahydropteroyltriglutamate--homocysteine methyltransferase
MRVAAYQHGIYPRSEAVVAATRGFERGRTSAEEVDAAFVQDRAGFVEVQREAGLDFFSDGLLRWQDIFRPLVDATPGLDARTLVRWFDNNSFFRSPEITGRIEPPAGLPGVLSDGDAVPAPRVATLPSPYLFSRCATVSGDRDALMQELTREVVAPVARSLSEGGYDVVQLQEPWLAYWGIGDQSWDELEKALTEIREAMPATTTLVLHTFFGDVGPHADRLRRLPVDVLGVDLVETDPASLGGGWDIGLLAGCLDGRSSLLESAEATVEFAKRAIDRTGAPTLFVSSNSDLELLPRDLARTKVERLGEIRARLVEELSRA